MPKKIGILWKLDSFVFCELSEPHMSKWKSSQNAEYKQTFEFTGKIEFYGKTCKNPENKQTWFYGKNEFYGKTRQNSGNKQSWFFRKIEFLREKLVKTLKINKLDFTGKIECEGNTK